MRNAVEIRNGIRAKPFRVLLALSIPALGWFVFGFIIGCFGIAAFPPDIKEGISGGLLSLLVSVSVPDIYFRSVSWWLREND
jgi:hypothetical protein